VTWTTRDSAHPRPFRFERRGRAVGQERDRGRPAIVAGQDRYRQHLVRAGVKAIRYQEDLGRAVLARHAEIEVLNRFTGGHGDLVIIPVDRLEV
jgi:hypothetical protein